MQIEAQTARRRRVAILELFCRAHVDQKQGFPSIHQLLYAIRREIIDRVFHPVRRQQADGVKEGAQPQE